MKLTSEESVLESPLHHSASQTSLNIQYYDEFTLLIKSCKIGYFISLDEFDCKNSLDKSFSKVKKIENKTTSKFSPGKRKNQNKPFKILRKLDVSINIKLLKEQLSSYIEKPRICLKIHLGNIVFGVHSFIILKLKSLEKSFNESIENSQDLLLFEKKNLLENATKLGVMRRFLVDKQLTERRFVILSDMYLYFFEGPDKTVYESYYHLRDANVQAEELIMTITNKQKQSLILICEDKDSLDEWVEILNKVIQKSQKSKGIKRTSRSLDSKLDNMNVVEVSVSVEMNEIKLNLYDSDHILWLGVNLSDFMIKFIKKTDDIQSVVSLGTFSVNSVDSDRDIPHDLKYFLSNVPFENVFIFFLIQKNYFCKILVEN